MPERHGKENIDSICVSVSCSFQCVCFALKHKVYHIPKSASPALYGQLYANYVSPLNKSNPQLASKILMHEDCNQGKDDCGDIQESHSEHEWVRYIDAQTNHVCVLDTLITHIYHFIWQKERQEVIEDKRWEPDQKRASSQNSGSAVMQ